MKDTCKDCKYFELRSDGWGDCHSRELIVNPLSDCVLFKKKPYKVKVKIKKS